MLNWMTILKVDWIKRITGGSGRRRECGGTGIEHPHGCLVLVRHEGQEDLPQGPGWQTRGDDPHRSSFLSLITKSDPFIHY